MKVRQTIIYSLFFVSVAYGFYFHVLSDQGGKRYNPGHTDGTIINSFAPTDITPVYAAVTKASSANNPPAKNRKWGRNPFRNKSKDSEAPSITPSAAIVKFREPRLTIVSVAENDTLIMANGRIMAVGDMLGEWKLIKIARTNALFAGPGGSYWAKLGG